MFFRRIFDCHALFTMLQASEAAVFNACCQALQAGMAAAAQPSRTFPSHVLHWDVFNSLLTPLEQGLVRWLPDLTQALPHQQSVAAQTLSCLEAYFTAVMRQEKPPLTPLEGLSLVEASFYKMFSEDGTGLVPLFARLLLPQHEVALSVQRTAPLGSRFNFLPTSIQNNLLLDYERLAQLHCAASLLSLCLTLSGIHKFVSYSLVHWAVVDPDSADKKRMCFMGAQGSWAELRQTDAKRSLFCCFSA